MMPRIQPKIGRFCQGSFRASNTIHEITRTDTNRIFVLVRVICGSALLFEISPVLENGPPEMSLSWPKIY